MEKKTLILEAATELLEASPNGDIATRAVGERAGVQQPVIYRLFGDKDRLLAAVVDHGFGHYVAAKRAAVPSADPVADLRRSWDEHTRFALEHPNLYRLMYTPQLASTPQALGEARELLLAVLERIARAGRLAVEPEPATEIVLAANTGIALRLLTRSREERRTALSDRVRETVLAGLLTPWGDDGPADTGEAGAGLAQAATTLGALLRSSPPAGFSPSERALLAEWLTRLSGGGPR